MKDYFATMNPAVPLSQPQDAAPPQTPAPGNVRGAERAASLAGGAALLYYGLRRGGVLGAVSALAGGGLLIRGATGHCAAKDALTLSPEERQIALEYGWSSAAASTQRITVRRPRQEVYAFWRNFENLARFMRNVANVEVIDAKRSRWTVKAPLGRQFVWVSHLIEDRPGERIAWETEYDADIRSTGWVEFRDTPDGQGTDVTAMIAYEPPAGRVGHLAARLWREDPDSRVRQDLRRLKFILETGAVGQAGAGSATPPGSNQFDTPSSTTP